MEVLASDPKAENHEETERVNVGYTYDEPAEAETHQDKEEKHLSVTPVLDNNAAILVVVESPKTQQEEPKLELLLLKATVEDNSKLSFKERMKKKNIPGGLTIHSFLLFLTGSQNIWSLAFVCMIQLLSWLGIIFLENFLNTYWWISMIALGVYGILYFVIWKLKVRLRVSSASFFCIIIATSCESILIVYMALNINAWIVTSAMIQITCSLYLAGCLAQCMKDSYTSVLGRVVAVASSLVSLIFGFVFLIVVWDILLMVRNM